jgi:L-alanine-DL-glutamate epimerase-like enolase superfamily enzyme
MQPTFRIAEIELLEAPVVLRMPFRFGIVTLRECFQAFVRVRIETLNGKSAWGATAEMIAPKWFDKNPSLTDDENFEQERDVLRIARQAYLSDSSADTAFGHFIRHHDSHLKFCASKGYNPLLASYGNALIDKAVLDALCRERNMSFYQVMQSNSLGMDNRHPQFDGINFSSFLNDLSPSTHIHARHTVGMVDAITADDITEPVNDGLPETLEQVVAHYGHRYYKLKVCGQLDKDIARLTDIASVLDQIKEPYFASLDGNEQYKNAEEVAELFSAMRATPALNRMVNSIMFVEQPISRAHALDTDLSHMALGLPIIMDESDGTLDAFVKAKDKGYSGISSKTCKGIYKSFLNAARCQQWNAERTGKHFFMSGEDLTVQAGLSIQQDLALVNLLGITHVERNGHHYVNGLASCTKQEQTDFLQSHGDLYENSFGATRVKISGGRLNIASLACTGFASAAMPDFSRMQPIRHASHV